MKRLPRTRAVPGCEGAAKKVAIDKKGLSNFERGFRRHDCEIFGHRWIRWKHAVDSIAPPVRTDWLRDSRKGGIHESSRLGERSSGLRNYHRRGGSGSAKARRNDC